MKLLRHGAAGAEHPDALDAQGRMRDESERDWQTKRNGQCGKGKGFDGFGPLGQQTGGARLQINRRHGS